VEENGEVDVVTRRHDCGVIAEPGNAASIAAAIRALYHDRTRTAQLGANARAASRLFDRRLQVQRYFDVFSDVRRPELRSPSLTTLNEQKRM
jgi:glycosyltransferase involved in cell wall biosynthesis